MVIHQPDQTAYRSVLPEEIGAVIVLPGGTPHFHWAISGTYVIQVSAVGPLGLEYIDPIDDSRNQ